jgi:hypothetical protein
MAYNTLGKLIARITDEPLEAGVHSVCWRPEQIPSGMYIVRLYARGVEQDLNFTSLRKVVYLK